MDSYKTDSDNFVVLNFVKPTWKTITCNIKTIANELFVIVVRDNTTVLDLKRKLEDIISISANRQKLFYVVENPNCYKIGDLKIGDIKGKELGNDTIFKDSGIVNKADFYLSVRYM